MLLTFDIGNTNIHMGGMEEGKVKFACRLSAVTTRTADEYAVLLDSIAKQNGLDLRSAEGAIIASVVPQLTQVLKSAILTVSGINASILGPGVRTGLNIRIDDPSQLGGDLVAAAVGAIGYYSTPCIMIDMSTATAFGVLDKSGDYIGCIIYPGVMVSQNALASGASQLLHVGPEAPTRLIGKNTVDSMRSGLVYGTAAVIDGCIERIEAELGELATVVITGDWAGEIPKYCRRKDIINDPDLVMRGLWNIYRKNKK